MFDFEGTFFIFNTQDKLQYVAIQTLCKRAQFELDQYRREQKQTLFESVIFQFDSEYFMGGEAEDAVELPRDKDGLLIEPITSEEMQAALRQHTGSVFDRTKDVIEIESKGARPISLRIADGQTFTKEEELKNQLSESQEKTGWQKFTSSIAKLCGTSKKEERAKESDTESVRMMEQDSEMLRQKSEKMMKHENSLKELRS